MQGWTVLDQLGYLADDVAQPGTRIITDSDIPVGAQVTFSSDTVYTLSGMVFVDSLAVLTIEPGTIIKAETGQGNQASGLVVTRYGKIFAEGTSDRPIIFTSVNDNLNGNLTFSDRGEWGGVVILGRASTNNQTPDGLKEIEGVNEIAGPGDNRALYGGNEDDHSSGVFRYVSIRHTGINVGDQAGNEIQGLTLGGVGRGTIIEYVESYASSDDGFEFFGGTVNTKYLVSAFNEDDSYDYDEGFLGKGQFWFAIQAPDLAGRVAEQDGATGDEFYTPFAIPEFANVTYIGAGIGATPEGDGSELLIFRDNAGGKYFNSIFTDYDDASVGAGITVEDIDNTGSKTEDSRKRLEAGDIALQNNIWWDFGAGNTLAGVAPQDFVQTYLGDVANGNQIVDPQLRGISRATDGGLDPRPTPGSPALSGAKTIEDDFFVQTSYVGAFGGNNWMQGWTVLDQLGYTATSIEEIQTNYIPRKLDLEQNYPNPFNPSTSIEFSLPQAGKINLSIYNSIGQRVITLVDGYRSAGTYKVNLNAENLASGWYVYQLITKSSTISRKMLLIK
jgi:hypothetical protein